MSGTLIGYRLTRDPSTVVRIEQIDGEQEEFFVPVGPKAIETQAYKNYQQWLAAGNTPAPRPLAEVAEEQLVARVAQDAALARVDPKLQALSTRDPAQIRGFVAANVNNLAEAKDMIATLAVAVSILARRL